MVKFDKAQAGRYTAREETSGSGLVRRCSAVSRRARRDIRPALAVKNTRSRTASGHTKERRMTDIRRKGLALWNTTGRVLMLAAVCALCCAGVWIWASASMLGDAPLPPRQNVLLAFAGDVEAVSGNAAGEFPITLTVEGESRLQMITGGTVADALDAAGVVVSRYDLVTPDPAHVLEEFDEIVVERREQETYTVEQHLPFETQYYYSPDVTPGEQVIRVDGENGLQVDTYSQLLLNGEVDEEKLVGTAVVREPVDKEIMIGFRSWPVSDLDFKWSFDENGEPEDYIQVLRAVKSAGYSAGPGAKTASGLPARVGHVAVDPNEIPYGSKLFIQSPDGSFVYGYAIAADTGTALKQNRIDVDLFYATYAQSAANGIREVDIYILE